LKVSVNIITCNRLSLLRRAVKSVLCQDYDDYEIVIVDSSGVGSVRKCIDEFDNPKIKVLDYLANKFELSLARNLCLRESSGKYIAVLDDDDEWVCPSKMRWQVEYMDYYPDCVLTGTDISIITLNGSDISYRMYPHCDQEIRDSMLVENPFCHSATMFRRDMAMGRGGYKQVKGLWNINEYELWMKLGLLGKMANLPFCGVSRMVWPNNMTFRHRLILYKKDFGLAIEYRHEYPNFLKSAWRYCVSYPIKWSVSCG